MSQHKDTIKATKKLLSPLDQAKKVALRDAPAKSALKSARATSTPPVVTLKRVKFADGTRSETNPGTSGVAEYKKYLTLLMKAAQIHTSANSIDTSFNFSSMSIDISKGLTSEQIGNFKRILEKIELDAEIERSTQNGKHLNHKVILKEEDLKQFMNDHPLEHGKLPQELLDTIKNPNTERSLTTTPSPPVAAAAVVPVPFFAPDPVSLQAIAITPTIGATERKYIDFKTPEPTTANRVIPSIDQVTKTMTFLQDMSSHLPDQNTMKIDTLSTKTKAVMNFMKDLNSEGIQNKIVNDKDCNKAYGEWCIAGHEAVAAYHTKQAELFRQSGDTKMAAKAEANAADAQKHVKKNQEILAKSQAKFAGVSQQTTTVQPVATPSVAAAPAAPPPPPPLPPSTTAQLADRTEGIKNSLKKQSGTRSKLGEIKSNLKKTNPTLWQR